MRCLLLLIGVVTACHQVAPVIGGGEAPSLPASDASALPLAEAASVTPVDAGAPQSCPPQDPAGPARESAWLKKVAPGIEFGKTTPKQLYAKLGRPLRSYEQGEGVTVHLYSSAALTPKRSAGQRYFYERGGVIVVLAVDDRDAPVRRDRVRAELSEFSFRTKAYGETTFDFVCGVGARADLGLFFWYNPQGVLMESSLSAWKTWKLKPNPCEDACSEHR